MGAGSGVTAGPPAPPLPAIVGRAPTSAIRRHDDPRAFLLEVMNDPSVAMELRIDAAKALLQP